MANARAGAAASSARKYATFQRRAATQAPKSPPSHAPAPESPPPPKSITLRHGAPGAVAHLNADHPDSLLMIATALSGHTDAEEARCVGADRYGLDLDLLTARGRTGARVGFEQPVDEPDGLRAATVALVGRAREHSA